MCFYQVFMRRKFLRLVHYGSLTTDGSISIIRRGFCSIYSSTKFMHASHTTCPSVCFIWQSSMAYHLIPLIDSFQSMLVSRTCSWLCIPSYRSEVSTGAACHSAASQSQRPVSVALSISISLAPLRKGFSSEQYEKI